MKKQTSGVEWYLATDDADWNNLCGLPAPDAESDAAPPAQKRLCTQPWLWVGALLLLWASAGGWRWRSAQSSLGQHGVKRQMAGQHPSAAEQDNEPGLTKVGGGRMVLPWQVPQLRLLDDLRAAIQSDDAQSQVAVPLESIEFQGNQALAEVIILDKSGKPAFRQMRFYRHMASGWQPTAPDASLWGPEHSLETPSFLFHFRQRDARAVIAVAPQIEAFYTTLRRDFALPPHAHGVQKLLIEVSMTRPSGSTSWLGTPNPLVVASPARYQAPVELTDAELLAQSIALPLLNDLLAQAVAHHQLPPSWGPLVDGLRLWQVWDMDLPLATWRADVVQWIYVDLPAATHAQPFVLPKRYGELCASHKLWMPHLVQIHIPLICPEQVYQEANYAFWHALAPPTRLDQFALPGLVNEHEAASRTDLVYYPVQAVALATLIEYGVAAYGRERLPALVTSLKQHSSWDTLLPAVFGVSASEFEAGWQDYLRTRYGR